MILIVDDHLDTGTVLSRLLTLNGQEAVATTSGKAALHILKARRPALIILDINMPDMNGLEVLNTIRGDERVQDVPVVMYSSENKDETMKEAARLGAKDYLVKAAVSWIDVLDTVKAYAA